VLSEGRRKCAEYREMVPKSVISRFNVKYVAVRFHPAARAAGPKADQVMAGGP
jgi:hypothetical protein